MRGALTGVSEAHMTHQLASVERMMIEWARRSPLAETDVDPAALIGGGKRLRARLALRVAPVADERPEIALAVAAAVEMVHAASLLHDDVIDGGRLRRGAPAFWVAHGVQGAILVGDLLMCAAYDLLRRAAPVEVLHALVEHTREVCSAEVEQELVLRGRPITWAAAERAARLKTGALFAFAAYGAAGARGPLADALREAGYHAGTAYQLSDDLLDQHGDSREAGKTLGRDAARRKHTAAALADGDPMPVLRRLDELREAADRRLADWPEALEAWRVFWMLDLQPALDANTHAARDNRSGGPSATGSHQPNRPVT